MVSNLFINLMNRYKKSAEERQALQDKIKAIDKEMDKLSITMEQIHTVKKYQAYY